MPHQQHQQQPQQHLDYSTTNLELSAFTSAGIVNGGSCSAVEDASSFGVFHSAEVSQLLSEFEAKNPWLAGGDPSLAAVAAE